MHSILKPVTPIIKVKSKNIIVFEKNSVENTGKKIQAYILLLKCHTY
jgi:hypothetical protein